MPINFVKMHGAGNDFVVLDEKNACGADFSSLALKLCDRHRGVGGDGMIIVSKLDALDEFRMDFFNSDGSRASMCGNGLRCAALFAHKRMGGGKKLLFHTDSGRLPSEIIGTDRVKIVMGAVCEFRKTELLGMKVLYGNTGVPHAVIFVQDPLDFDVVGTGRRIRNHEFFSPAGTNVNFVSTSPDSSGAYRIRTYERGVEDETCACGTGALASALCLFSQFGAKSPVLLATRQNDILKVEKIESGASFGAVCALALEGPAAEVFAGELLF